jgi:hypothetical protein
VSANGAEADPKLIRDFLPCRIEQTFTGTWKLPRLCAIKRRLSRFDYRAKILENPTR